MENNNEQCCPLCFTVIPEEHFERKAYHDNEHCPKCGNDLMGGSWYNNTISKHKAHIIHDVLRSNVDYKKENGELREQLKTIVLYGKSFIEWMYNYGNPSMTSQRQSLKNLVEKFNDADKYLNKNEV